MARPSLKAQFFVTPDGTVIPKAPPLMQSIKRQIYEEEGGLCRDCGREVRFGGNDYTPWDQYEKHPGQIDHIFPRSRGGQNYRENLQLLCLCCNSQKGTHDVSSDAWREAKAQIEECRIKYGRY